MVSALIPSKRIEMGIEAVRRIPDAHLVVAGDGPLRNQIAVTASEYIPGRFTRLSVRQEQMPMLYQAADVFLHCSKDEAFGIVFLEAMASGLPVVAHDTARARWLVGDREFLVNTDNVAEIAKAIQRAKDTDSVARQNRIGRALKFSWPKIAAAYRDFFEDIISN